MQKHKSWNNDRKNKKSVEIYKKIVGNLLATIELL